MRRSDEKRLIRSREAKIRILQAFRWVPDRLMLSLQYRVKTGRRLNWSSPTRFTEKLQLYKILTRDNALMARCADKGEVRAFVAERGWASILVPLIGVYDAAAEIPWDELPRRFVMKDTLGSGGNSVIICRDKEQLDKEAVLRQCAQWAACRDRHPGREHVYDHGKHRILLEEYLDASAEAEGLVDYKFFCFDGKPACLYAVVNRALGKDAEIGIYDMDFHLLPYRRVGERPPSHALAKPVNFSRMVEIAQTLSRGFPEVRVDLYHVGGRVYFGEMTFFNGSGYSLFEPDDFDFRLGEAFVLPEKRDGSA